MKTLFLVSALLAAPALAQTSAPATPASAATFDWKLRLTKGQTWTQNMTSTSQMDMSAPDPATKKSAPIHLTITQIMGIKNVVLDATPEFYLIRSTYSAFSVKTDISMNGKSTPTPKTPDYGQSLVGASFTIKQAPDGRVLDVMGLEDLVARMQRSFATPNQTPQQRAQFARFLPSAKTLKETISKNQSAALPKTPLAVGQSFSYAVALPSSFPMNMTLSSKKTLLSFDVQSATFGDNGTFNTSATQPLVMGKTKTYTAMKGTISGQSVVDTETGLPRSSTTTTKITGKVTVVQAGQAPVSVPLALTSQATVVTTTP